MPRKIKTALDCARGYSSGLKSSRYKMFATVVRGVIRSTMIVHGVNSYFFLCATLIGLDPPGVGLPKKNSRLREGLVNRIISQEQNTSSIILGKHLISNRGQL